MIRGKAADKIGACLSAICAVHCVLTGFAFGLLSVVGLGFLGNPTVEVVFIGASVVVGLYAVVHGVRRHHSIYPALLFVSGLVLIALSHFLGHRHSGGVSAQTTLGSALAVSGGVMICVFHIANMLLQHRGCSCHLHDGHSRADYDSDIGMMTQK